MSLMQGQMNGRGEGGSEEMDEERMRDRENKHVTGDKETREIHKKNDEMMNRGRMDNWIHETTAERVNEKMKE